MYWLGFDIMICHTDNSKISVGFLNFNDQKIPVSPNGRKLPMEFRLCGHPHNEIQQDSKKEDNSSDLVIMP